MRVADPDCAGVPDGPALADNCSVCDSNSTNDNLCYDCLGVAHGTALVDNVSSVPACAGYSLLKHPR